MEKRSTKAFQWIRLFALEHIVVYFESSHMPPWPIVHINRPIVTHTWRIAREIPLHWWRKIACPTSHAHTWLQMPKCINRLCDTHSFLCLSTQFIYLRLNFTFPSPLDNIHSLFWKNENSTNLLCIRSINVAISWDYLSLVAMRGFDSISWNSRNC